MNADCFTAAPALAPSMRPLPRMSCRPGETLMRVPTNPAMPCAGADDDRHRQLMREPAALWMAIAVPLAFVAAMLVAAVSS